jgi:hypothetical protein
MLSGSRKRQAAAVGRVDYTAVGDAQFVQPRFPLQDLIAVSASERQVVEAGTALVERLGTHRIGKLVQPDERLPAKKPHNVAEWARVLVEGGLAAE